MARPVQVSSEFALKNIMLLFWRRGYAATSMSDLESASGLSASSLYSRLGNKEQIFIAALELYVDSIIDARVQRYLLEPEDGALNGLKMFYRSTYLDLKIEHRRMACFLMSTGMDAVAEVASISAVLNRGNHSLQQGFLFALSSLGVSENQQIILARYLLSVLPGILLQAKNLATDKELDDVIDQIVLTVELSCKK